MVSSSAAIPLTTPLPMVKVAREKQLPVVLVAQIAESLEWLLRAQQFCCWSVLFISISICMCNTNY